MAAHRCVGTAGAIHAALDAGSGGRCVHRASFPARRKTCSGAAYHKRLIRGLPPSACLPFQARGKAPDQSLAPGTCLPFQARGKAPDQSLAPSTCLPFQARGKAPDQSLAPGTCLPFQARGKAPDRPPRPRPPSEANPLPPPRPPTQEQCDAKQHHVHQHAGPAARRAEAVLRQEIDPALARRE